MTVESSGLELGQVSSFVKERNHFYLHSTDKTFLNLSFYWRIIALQNFAVFCETSTWISHRCTYVPSILNLSPVSLPIAQQSWLQLGIHPARHMMYSAYKLNKQGDNIQPWCTSFPNLEPVCCSMSSFNCCFLTCIQVSQEAGKVVWYSHLLKNFPQFVVILIV